MRSFTDKSILTPIARSREYSDLTIVSQGVKFYVHKVVVCNRCDILKAAVDGLFSNHIIPSPEESSNFIITSEESTTNTIRINGFDADTVDRMIDYLYTGTYKPSPPVGSADYFELSATPGSTATSGASAFIPNSSVATAEEDDLLSHDPIQYLRSPFNPLLCHVRVNAIADYFNLPSLRLRANRNIDRLLQRNWNVEWFADFAQLVADICPTDSELLYIVTTIAALHITELAGREDWVRLEIPGNIHGEIYSKMMQAREMQRNERGGPSSESCMRSIQ